METQNLNRKQKAFAYRCALVRETEEFPYRNYPVRVPFDAVAIGRFFIKSDLDREVFAVALLSTRNTFIGWNEVSRGTLNGSLVHPREVFKPAIIGNGAAVILFHNHPSGDPSPSQEDRELTERLKAAGKVLGIEVLDHIILGDPPKYYSFKETETL